MTRDAKSEEFLPCMYAAGKVITVWYAPGGERLVYRECTNPAKESKAICARCADNISFVRRGHWPWREIWELLDDDDFNSLPRGQLDDNDGDLARISVAAERMVREHTDNMLRYDGILVPREEVLHGRTDNT